VRQVWPFGLGLLLLAGLGWALTGSMAARAGVTLSWAAAVLVLGLKAVAVRRSVKAALGLSVLGLVLRLGVWAAGYGWARRLGQDAGAYTLGFFAFFVVALGLEVTYVLVAAGAQRRGAM
jgi:hypothetical protein